MTDKEELTRGDALARVAVLEAENAELRKRVCVPDGWMVVPSQCTSQMEDAYDQQCADDNACGCSMHLPAYEAMLAAAPAPVERVGQEAGLYAVKFLDNWDGELNCYWLIARLDDKGEWLSEESGKALLQYEGDKILSAIRLDTPQPAPTAAQDVAGLVEALEQGFPLLSDDGLDEVAHHCEWAIQQDRKRLHALIAAHQIGGIIDDK